VGIRFFYLRSFKELALCKGLELNFPPWRGYGRICYSHGGTNVSGLRYRNWDLSGEWMSFHSGACFLLFTVLPFLVIYIYLFSIFLFAYMNCIYEGLIVKLSYMLIIYFDHILFLIPFSPILDSVVFFACILAQLCT
jgi:hypothetical protein